MIVGNRYRPSEVTDKYDVIVIGSGIGGMTTAALLSKAGRKVLVLERHYTAGGFTHSFSRKGYEWDVGVHYIGDLHREDTASSILFNAVTDGQLKWSRMDDVYDKIIFGDDEYNFVAGAKNFKEELLKSFPNGGAEIDAYLSAIRSVTQSAPSHFGPRFMPEMLQKYLAPAIQRAGGDYFNRSTKDVMAGLVSDPKLASVLVGQWGDYGVPPGQSAFGMQGLVAQHYLNGAYFPVGGASRIAASIKPVIERAGGKMLVNADVDQILVKKGRAYGVRMADGTEILAKSVVSAAGLYNTYGKMLPEQAGERQALKAKAESFTPAIAHVGLYIGLKGTTEELKLQQANRWVYRDYDHDGAMQRFVDNPSYDFPLQYISFPSAKDPSWNTNYPGRSTIDVIAPMPYDWVKDWAHMPWGKRGTDYGDMKEEIAQRLLETVYQQCPQVRGKVDYYELSTPLSTQHFNNYPHGELYGLAHTPERFGQSWVKPSTPIKGLYLTGQDILSCGVAAALAAGAMTAANMLGMETLRILPEFLPGRPAKSFEKRKKTGADIADAAPIMTRFTAKCVAVEYMTDDVRVFRFQRTDGTALAYKAGQFVTLELEIAGEKVFRSYTMSSTPTRESSFEITVKRVEGGQVSNWLCDHVAAGDEVMMSGPHGKFHLTGTNRRKKLFLSAGSGVTPMISMARWLNDTGRKDDVIYYHCARRTADILFKEEMQTLQQSWRGFKPHVSLTREKLDNWQGMTGYLDGSSLTMMAPDYKDREIYICGPEAFMSGIETFLQGQGFEMTHFHQESFGSVGDLDATGGLVLFEETGQKAKIAAGQTLLEGAENAGIDIENACRTGDCGLCKRRGVKGDIVTVSSEALDQDEIDEGYVLTCMASCNGDVVLAA